MIIQLDVKSLEIVAAGFLSQDKVLREELINKVDIHGNNQKAFDLPTRLIAKTLVFRILYGGSAFAFVKDPTFASVKGTEKYWQNVIDKFYQKYPGIKQWHSNIIKEATLTGRVVIPTGRFFPFHPKNGDYPITQIKNYPVQALGADLVSIIRVNFYNRFKSLSKYYGCDVGFMVSSVHDSIVVDSPSKELQIIAKTMHRSVTDCPRLFEERFGIKFNVPMTAEIKYGPNQEDMVEWN